MDWASIAILSAATLGVVNIIDSHLLTRRMPGLRAYLLPVGVMYLFYASLALYLNPLPEGVPLRAVLAGLASGLSRTTAVIIMLYHLRYREVSQVIPVTNTSPIFVALLAMPLLGESLSSLQWLAVVIVVTGAVLVSTGRAPAGATGGRIGTFLLLLMASLCFAFGDIATKYALGFLPFWNVFSLTAFVMGGGFLLTSVRPRVLCELREMPRRGPSLGLIAFNESLAPLGIVLSFWAMQRGPVSLVSTINGSRPVFVVLYSLIFSRVFPEFLLRFSSRRVLLFRLAAALLIFGGIAIIYLS